MLFIEYHTESEKQVVWIWDVCKYIGCLSSSMHGWQV